MWPLLLAGGVVAAGLAKKRSSLDSPDASQLEGGDSLEGSSTQIAGLGNRLNTDVATHAPRPSAVVKTGTGLGRTGRARSQKKADARNPLNNRPTRPGAVKVTVVKRGARPAKKSTAAGVAKSAARAGLGAAGVPPWGQDAIVNVGGSAVSTVKGWF